MALISMLWPTLFILPPDEQKNPAGVRGFGL